MQIKLDVGRVWRQHVDHVVLEEVEKDNLEPATPDVSPEEDPLTAPPVESSPTQPPCGRTPRRCRGKTTAARHRTGTEEILAHSLTPRPVQVTIFS